MHLFQPDSSVLTVLELFQMQNTEVNFTWAHSFIHVAHISCFLTQAFVDIIIDVTTERKQDDDAIFAVRNQCI